MRTFGGRESTICFTSLSKGSSEALDSSFKLSSGTGLAEAFTHQEAILDLAKKTLGEDAVNKVCLLDPKGEKELSPEDGDGRFQWFLFGVRAANCQLCS